jgi:hypothetical protein
MSLDLKRFLIFAFDTPKGGWRDLRTSEDNLDKAKLAAKELDYPNWQIIDTETGELIEGINL